jgi:hypothetical protein
MEVLKTMHKRELDHLSSAHLVSLAGQIEPRSCISEEMIPGLAAAFIGFYDQPFAATCDHRRLVARATARLAGRSSVALDLVIESALRYAAEMKEIDDADPYSPNSVEILAAVPPSEKVISVLNQIISDHPGMAQADAVDALAARGSGRGVPWWLRGIASEFSGSVRANTQ